MSKRKEAFTLQSHLDITSRLGGKNPCSLYRNSLYQKMHVKVWEKIFTKLFERLKNKGTKKITLSNTKNIIKTFKIEEVISVNEISH